MICSSQSKGGFVLDCIKLLTVFPATDLQLMNLHATSHQIHTHHHPLQTHSQQILTQFEDHSSEEYYSLQNLISRGRQPLIRNEQRLTKDEQKKLQSLSEALKACFELRKMVEEHQFGYFFKYPVDPYKLGLPDYWRVIKRPVDLTTVKRKFQGGLYVKASQFNQDMQLLFSNAVTYNSANKAILAKTNELLAFYQRHYQRIENMIRENRLTEKFQQINSSSSLISKLTTTQVVSIFSQARLEKLGRLLSFLNNRKKRSLLASLKKKYKDLPMVEGENQRIYFNKLSAHQIYDLVKLAKNISHVDFDMAKLMTFQRDSAVSGQSLEVSRRREEVQSQFQVEDD